LANDFSSEEMSFHVIFHEWPTINNENNKVHIYRIAQELFQNATKHSKAKQVFLQFLQTNDDELTIMYEDDGIGIKSSKANGLGMKNIRYRVETMNGEKTIEQMSSGMSMIITLPKSTVETID